MAVHAKKTKKRTAATRIAVLSRLPAPAPRGKYAGNEVRTLREKLGLSRRLFSRLSQYSERAIAEWESGERLAAASKQRMQELGRLQRGLASVMDEDYLGEWLQTPNDAFDGLKPLEVIERGHIDRIWRMIYQMESGVPG